MADGRAKNVPPSAKVGAQYIETGQKNKVAELAFADDLASQIPYL